MVGWKVKGAAVGSAVGLVVGASVGDPVVGYSVTGLCVVGDGVGPEVLGALVGF